ncbi:MAG: NAD(P)/FAD-dependent oxidoreductase [Rhizobiaceae bacterium]
MKRKLDLRTGTPVWMAYRSPSVPTNKLKRDVAADALVVGMGISGAMIAEMLTAAGLSVIVIDRRGPIRGSTAATTALVQYEIDVPLSVLSRKIGKEKAEQAWRRSRLAVANLHGHIEELGLTCDLRTSASLYLAGNALKPSALRGEGEARRAAGISSTYLTAGELKERFGIDRDGALLGHGNLALDPRKLTSGLLQLAAERGARLYAPVEAEGVESDQDGVRVSTAEGAVIRARDLVLATGYELLDPAPMGNHQVISTWAIATKPQKGRLPPNLPLIWEASDPYLYLRPTRDGRIICGGEDEEFADEENRDRLIAEKTERIAAKLAALLPGIDSTPEFRWAGSFGTTETGLPFIGRVPRRPHVFAVMGYGGNGITFSRIAAEILMATLTGGRDADAGLFAFPS